MAVSASISQFHIYLTVVYQRCTSGGGYSYRLCPASEPLTESCFQAHALDFSGNSSLRWGGIGGERTYFDSAALGWQVSEGTVPENSMWCKIPIPRTVNEWNMYVRLCFSQLSLNQFPFELYDWAWVFCCCGAYVKLCGANRYGASFEPVCEESDECKNSHYKKPRDVVCKCSGDWNDEVEIVDMVHLPANLKPGRWVLGWRWVTPFESLVVSFTCCSASGL